MRICFVGKGGSGKTTLASQFTSHLAAKGQPVLGIDADLNQHLMLVSGVEKTHTTDIGGIQSELYELFRGTNNNIAPGTMIKTTPPGIGSTVFRSIHDAARALTRFDAVTAHTTAYYCTVGIPAREDIGVRCYHSKTGMVELLLNHTVEKSDEYIVVDMTAGIDAFASGLYDKFDMMVVVVEPTMQSVAVYRQYQNAAAAVGMHVYSVGNKAFDAADSAFLQEQIGADLVTILPFSRSIRDREQCVFDTDNDPAVTTALEAIQSVLDTREKDWNAYLDRTIEIHTRNAVGWANAAKGIDLRQHIDSDFSYIDA